jgi:hypothetical protein
MRTGTRMGYRALPASAAIAGFVLLAAGCGRAEYDPHGPAAREIRRFLRRHLGE